MDIFKEIKEVSKESLSRAKGRHKFMVEFFDRINQEVDGEL